MAGSILGSVAGSVAGAATSSLFGGSSSDAERLAAQGQQVFTPEPFQAKSFLFDVNQNGNAFLNQFGKNRFANKLALSNRAFYDAKNFDRRNFADRLLAASEAVNNKREGQAFRSLESKLFNSQGAHSGTQRQIADFASDIEDRRFQRALQAEVGSQQFGRSLLNDYQAAFNDLMGLEDRRQALQAFSLEGGRAMLPMVANNPAMGQLGLMQQQRSDNFANGLGGLVGGAVNAGYNYFSQPTPSFNPFAWQQPANPFNGSGPLLSFGN